MSKELWMAAQEKLIEEYLEEHEGSVWSEAYEKTSDLVTDRLRDMLANAADQLKDRRKYDL